TDNSAQTRTNISTNFFMMGAFERGDDTKGTLIGGGQSQFQQTFGYISNTFTPQVYVGAIQLLQYAQGVWMINVTKNALYGGLLVTAGGGTPLVTGLAAKSYNFQGQTYSGVATTG